MESPLPPRIPEVGGTKSICPCWRGLCPSPLSLTQVLDTLWLVGNRGATDARLVLVPALCTKPSAPAHSQGAGRGSAARDKETSWTMQTLRVWRIWAWLSTGWRFTLKKGKKILAHTSPLTSITLENKDGMRARNKSLPKMYWVIGLIFCGIWVRVGE